MMVTSAGKLCLHNSQRWAVRGTDAVRHFMQALTTPEYLENVPGCACCLYRVQCSAAVSAGRPAGSLAGYFPAARIPRPSHDGSLARLCWCSSYCQLGQLCHRKPSQTRRPAPDAAGCAGRTASTPSAWARCPATCSASRRRSWCTAAGRCWARPARSRPSCSASATGTARRSGCAAGCCGIRSGPCSVSEEQVLAGMLGLECPGLANGAKGALHTVDQLLTTSASL